MLQQSHHVGIFWESEGAPGYAMLAVPLMSQQVLVCRVPLEYDPGAPVQGPTPDPLVLSGLGESITALCISAHGRFLAAGGVSNQISLCCSRMKLCVAPQRTVEQLSEVHSSFKIPLHCSC